MALIHHHYSTLVRIVRLTCIIFNFDYTFSVLPMSEQEV